MIIVFGALCAIALSLDLADLFSRTTERGIPPDVVISMSFLKLPDIAQKLLPFAVLLVFVGVVGTGVATTQLTSSAAAQFDANLLHNSLVANQLLAQLDLARTADLRLATDTVGVPEAVLSDDVNALIRLLSPVAANVTAATTVVSVVDSHGAVLLRIENS